MTSSPGLAGIHCDWITDALDLGPSSHHESVSRGLASSIHGFESCYVDTCANGKRVYGHQNTIRAPGNEFPHWHIGVSNTQQCANIRSPPRRHSCVHIRSTHAAPTSHQPHRFAHEGSWKKRAKGAPRHSKSIQSGTFKPFCRLGRRPLNGHSLHDALRAFFKPIKNDDPRLDFYTVYKREATDYDTDYVKKYDEDLNITLIFVRHLPFAPTAI